MLQIPQAQAERSDPADLARKWLSLSWLAVVVGGIYILAAKLKPSLLTPDGVAVFWPAAGVAAGALIAFGPRGRWAVAVGTMAATIVANLLAIEISRAPSSLPCAMREKRRWQRR
jgi:hypothetical protein